MKTIIHGYCEIMNGEFICFAKDKSYWLGEHANPIGKIVKCKITIEYSLVDEG